MFWLYDINLKVFTLVQHVDINVQKFTYKGGALCVLLQRLTSLVRIGKKQSHTYEHVVLLLTDY
jgi:hypothetical protein